MSRAILVLDEMPNDCKRCELMEDFDEDCARCFVTNHPIRNGYAKKRCPLKEMPKERILPTMEVLNTNYGEEPWFSDGWNACLEEIEK